ncbi:MAG TPA: M67 family metallopeptidase [Candidatus Acidoferrum sp.]|jgi:proteasome lid subunit RPN8/RPN11
MAENFQLWISHDLSERIRRHGAETFPHECCGALLGRDSVAVESGNSEESETPREVLDLFPLVNRRDDSPRNRFAVAADDVRNAEKAARQHGLEVVGWYHSHPDHPAQPSQFDREHAWPWYSYIIVSVMSGAPAEMTSWRLNDDRQDYSAESIEIRNSAGA